MAEAKETKKKTAKKPGTKAAEKAKAKAPKVVEQAETATEADITAAALDEAKQEATVIAEKRSTKPVAKAGKRSAKAVKETEEKLEKEARKAESSDEKAEEKPKKQQKPARSRLERRAKGYRDSAKLIDREKYYKVAEALELATKTSHVKFDATVELHLNLAVDPKQADQNVRDTVVLPAGTGKTSRVAVFAEADTAATAKKAGADIAGAEEFLEQLDKGKIDFDVLIATPSVMAKLGKYARVLGPKGLMPNPKSGTVTNDVTKAVKEAKAGRVEYRVDSTGIIHVGVGKVSFGKDKLLENTKAIITSVKGNKPAGLKSAYLNAAHVTTSMGPSMRLDIADVNSL